MPENNIVEIVAKFINEASPGIKGLASDVSGLNETQKESAGASAGMSDGLAGLAGQLGLTLSAAGLAAGAFALMKSSIDAYGESEVVAAQVNAVIQSTGGIAGVTAAEVDNLATRLSEMSGVDDEVIAKGQAILLTFTKVGGDVFPRATEAALNMSAAMGTDLQGSMVQLGKALNDPIAGVSALQRVGVVLSATQEEQIKQFMAVNDIASAQGIILQELETEFGGVAAAMGDTTVGATNKLKNAWGNLLETMGENPAGAWQLVAEGVTGLVVSMDEGAQARNDYWETFRKGNELLLVTEGHFVKTRAEAQMYEDRVMALGAEWARSAAMGEYWVNRLAATSEVVPGVIESNNQLVISMDAVKAGISGVIGNAQDQYIEKMERLGLKHDELVVKQQDLIARGYQPTSEKVMEVTNALLENENAQTKAAAAMDDAITKMIFQQAAAGLDAQATLELARSMGVLDEESYAVATVTQGLKKQYDEGKLSAQEYAQKVAELRDRVNSLQDKKITITVDTIQNTSVMGLINQGVPTSVAQQIGYSDGGISTGPDDGHLELLHGTEAVIPLRSGSIPVSLSGAGSLNQSPTVNNFSLVVSSPVTVLDKHTTTDALRPFVEELFRQSKADGWGG